MGDRSPEERLAAHLKLAIEALRAERPDTAVLHLRPVCDDPSLAASQELADVRARALTLLAQSLLAHDDAEVLDEAERRLDDADRIDDNEAGRTARAELRARLVDLRQDAMEARANAARTERLAARDVEPWLAKISDPDRRCDLLTQKAQAELTAGRSAEGLAFAERALALADEVSLRAHVMALLTVARARPEAAERFIHEALALADAASEPTLVGTTVKTAQLLSVPLPVQEGPSLSKRS